MYITEWVEQEDKSYFETILSIRIGMTPIFKVRAVKMSDGKYMAVVRDYITGTLLGSHQKQVNKGLELDIAKQKAVEIASMLLIFDNSQYCSLLGQSICPQTFQDPEICNRCKIKLRFKKLEL